MVFSKKKKKKKRTGFKLILHQLPHAITYLSDFFIFLMIFTWMFYIINGTFAGWYSIVNNADSTVFTDLKDACTIPLVTGGVMWLLKCALNHYNSMHKNGKKLAADFPNDDDIDDDDFDFGDVEDDDTDDEFFDDDDSIEDDPEMDAEMDDEDYDEAVVEDDDLGDEEEDDDSESEEVLDTSIEENSEEAKKTTASEEEEYFVDTDDDDE